MNLHHRMPLLSSLFIVMTSSFLLLTAMPPAAGAGSLDPPPEARADGGDPAPTMRTLEEIYEAVQDVGLAVENLEGWLGGGTDAPAPVEFSGQTKSTETGDDGYYRLGVEWPTPRFTANVDLNGDGDCTDPGETCDGTVTDNLTGLIWLRDVLWFNADPEDERCDPSHVDYDPEACDMVEGLDWADALQACNNLASGVFGLNDGSVAGDWRMANMKELQSLMDYGNHEPALPDNHPFTLPDEKSYYSSNTVAHDNDSVYSLNIGTGTVDSWPKVSGASNARLVWPVRGPN